MHNVQTHSNWWTLFSLGTSCTLWSRSYTSEWEIRQWNVKLWIVYSLLYTLVSQQILTKKKYIVWVCVYLRAPKSVFRYAIVWCNGDKLRYAINCRVVEQIKKMFIFCFLFYYTFFVCDARTNFISLFFCVFLFALSFSLYRKHRIFSFNYNVVYLISCFFFFILYFDALTWIHCYFLSSSSNGRSDSNSIKYIWY